MSQKSIRAALRLAQDGLTLEEIGREIQINTKCIRYSLKVMSDVYIDRWQKRSGAGPRYIPVYMAAEIPENAPKPD